jgi:hypothetical protein
VCLHHACHLLCACHAPSLPRVSSWLILPYSVPVLASTTFIYVVW